MLGLRIAAIMAGSLRSSDFSGFESTQGSTLILRFDTLATICDPSGVGPAQDAKFCKTRWRWSTLINLLMGALTSVRTQTCPSRTNPGKFYFRPFLSLIDLIKASLAPCGIGEF